MWTAALSDNAASKPAAASHLATAFPIRPALQVDLNALLFTAPADSSARAAAKQQLYGKSVCYCPATAMYIASLGNADNEDQNVTWLMTVGNDGRTIGQASSVQMNSSPASADTGADSASSADSAGLQHPDPESDAEHADSSEEEDQDEEGSSDEGGTDRAALPTVQRSYVIPVLPVSRQEMQSPGLVLGVPSHGLPGLVSTLFESAHSDGTGCALVSQILDMQVRLLDILQEVSPAGMLRTPSLYCFVSADTHPVSGRSNWDTCVHAGLQSVVLVLHSRIVLEAVSSLVEGKSP